MGGNDPWDWGGRDDCGPGKGCFDAEDPIDRVLRVTKEEVKKVRNAPENQPNLGNSAWEVAKKAGKEFAAEAYIQLGPDDKFDIILMVPWKIAKIAEDANKSFAEEAQKAQALF